MSLASDIAAARREIERAMLPDSCVIQSLIGATSDSAGGSSGGTWTTQGDPVACQVTTAGKIGPAGQETVVANGLVEVVDASIAVPAATAVVATQRIVHTGQSTTTTYEVISVSKPTGFEIDRTVKGKVVT